MFTKPILDTTTNYPQQFGRLVDQVEGPPRRNWIRNGDFQIVQRGTSFAVGGSLIYTLDGWVSGGQGTTTVSQQVFTVGQTAVPGNPRFCAQIDRTVAAVADNDVFDNRIEFPEFLSGKTVTVGFWARVVAGTKTLLLDLASGGSVAPAVDTADNSVALTTAWTFYSFSIAVPALTAAPAGSYIALRIAERTTYSTFTLQIADVQLEIGSEATLFERLTFGEQLRWNQRFYWKTFDQGVAVAQNSGSQNGAITYIVRNGGGTQYDSVPVYFPARMRAAPTITFYNPSAANAKWRNTNLAADSSTSAAVGLSVGEGGFVAQNQQVAGDLASHTILVHAAATAEL